MVRIALLLMSFFVASAQAQLISINCEEKRDLCVAKCEVINLLDESGLSQCKAQCTGQWISCNVDEAAQKVKKAVENAHIEERTKGFWQGLTEEPKN